MLNSVPADYNADLAICAAHFTEDSFTNPHEFNTGFAQRLLLKDHAVLTLKAEAAVYGPKTVSTRL
ncbi:THAP domain-containing protein, partial [Klebsiella aerogenes]|uniref:THAP domain-containing protein n=1 Tax=Klebsiella aerogenes TaxID=548 RepID=UPI001CC4A15A